MCILGHNVKDVVYSLRGNDLNNKGVGQFDEQNSRKRSRERQPARFPACPPFLKM
jgi:hypothetical protein